MNREREGKDGEEMLKRLVFNGKRALHARSNNLIVLHIPLLTPVALLALFREV